MKALCTPIAIGWLVVAGGCGVSTPTPETSAPTPTQPNATTVISVQPIGVIGWARHDEIRGGESVSLWPEGHSRVATMRYGVPERVKPGWRATTKEVGGDTITSYQKNNYFSSDEAVRLYEAAVVAGIKNVKSFDNPNGNGSGTMITIRNGFHIESTRVPEFYGEGQEDHNIGSENHKRFLAVKKIMDEVLDNFEVYDFRPTWGVLRVKER